MGKTKNWFWFFFSVAGCCASAFQMGDRGNLSDYFAFFIHLTLYSVYTYFLIYPRKS